MSTLAIGADSLGDRIQPLIADHPGEVSVAIKHFGTGESFEFQAQRPMPTASLIKFPLMIAAYQAAEQGKLDLDSRIVLSDDDQVPGSGILTSHFSAGTEFSVRDAIRLMMVYSDNTATNLVIDQVGLPATATLMESLGCPHTKLHSKVYRGETTIFPERSRKFGLGSTTAAEMIRLLEMLYGKKLVSASASQQMLNHMFACDSKDRIPRLLPPGTKIAHKTGAVSAVRCDAGIVEAPGGAFAICVLTRDNKDRRWTDDNAADLLCARIAQAAYRQLAKETPESVPENLPIEIGASGRLVEALQRTLNDRLDPSPELSIDGDFGPVTQAAVIRFQQASKLPASGNMDAATWSALGPLRYDDDPVPDPAVVNAVEVDKQPADELRGVPYVTCKAWAIADGRSGKLLWGDHQDQPLPMASTTKIMTAQLVFQLAKQSPSVLDEIVTFSQRADETAGSTCGIRAGETITVGELLYGLLLPSGNDASVALGEHFGQRLAAEVADQDPYESFVAAMNVAANQLGLKHTRFINTHGMSDPGHHSSAGDLLKLSWHALQDPAFAKYVATPQHGCQVAGPGGYRRNLIWRNSNRLLKIAGYDGVKTGTTTAAGACLVSRSVRGERSLMLVVLGSAASDSRYADTRNLYRWAWNQLQALDAVPVKQTPAP